MTPEAGTKRPRTNQTTPSRTSRSLTLTTGALTLFGVALSVGVTVAFGVSGPLWLRIAAGFLTTGGLLMLIKLMTKSGRGPLARFAHWIIGAAEDES